MGYAEFRKRLQEKLDDLYEFLKETLDGSAESCREEIDRLQSTAETTAAELLPD